jgi:hypothetical protein
MVGFFVLLALGSLSYAQVNFSLKDGARLGFAVGSCTFPVGPHASQERGPPGSPEPVTRYFPRLDEIILAIEIEIADWATPNDPLRRLCAIT